MAETIAKYDAQLQENQTVKKVRASHCRLLAAIAPK
jgi:hypothetical protein